MKNLFLDTNVIIDVLANRAPFAIAGAKLIDLSEKGKVNLYVSALSYTNIYYVLRKEYTHKKLVNLLKELEAILKTINVTDQIISKSLLSDFTDFEDAIQYYTAISHKKIECIITRNGKDFQLSELSVLTPDEALNIIYGKNR